MEFTLIVRNADGERSPADKHTLESMREELAALSNVLEALVIGETIEIRRIS